MESSNLYYSFSLDEDLEIPVESVLELGEKLKRVRDYLRGEYNPLINKFELTYYLFQNLLILDSGLLI